MRRAPAARSLLAACPPSRPSLTNHLLSRTGRMARMRVESKALRRLHGAKLRIVGKGETHPRTRTHATPNHTHTLAHTHTHNHTQPHTTTQGTGLFFYTTVVSLWLRPIKDFCWVLKQAPNKFAFTRFIAVVGRVIFCACRAWRPDPPTPCNAFPSVPPPDWAALRPRLAAACSRPRPNRGGGAHAAPNAAAYLAAGT